MPEFLWVKKLSIDVVVNFDLAAYDLGQSPFPLFLGTELADVKTLFLSLPL